jgi:hypothetical protein
VSLLGGWGYFTSRLGDEVSYAREQEKLALRREDEANTQWQRAEDEKVIAQAAEQKAGRQLERTRRTLFTNQLWRAAAVWERDPRLAHDLLDDTATCPVDWRDFAWEFYHRLSRRDRRALRTGQGTVNGLAFASDGRTLATAGDDGVIKVWGAAGREERLVLPKPPGYVRALVFTDSGRSLAAAIRPPAPSGKGQEPGAAVVYDLSTKRMRTVFQGGRPGGGGRAAAPPGRESLVAGGRGRK